MARVLLDGVHDPEVRPDFDPVRTDYSAIPVELLSQPAAVFILEPRPEGGWAKQPRNCQGFPLSPKNLAKWEKAEDCKAAVNAGLADGWGVRLTEGCGIVGWDTDHAEETLKQHPALAKAIKAHRAKGGYVEVSPSGKGLRGFIFGDPVTGRKRGNHVEMYSEWYLTLTGAGSGAILEDQELRDALVAAMEAGTGGDNAQGSQTSPATSPPAPSASQEKPTAEILAKVEAASREKLGDAADRFIPAGEMGGISFGWSDPSRQDNYVVAEIYRTCARFGVPAEQRPEVMETIMGRFGVGQRDKWQNRADYRERTVRAVIQSEAAKPQAHEVEGAGADDGGNGDKANPRPELIRGDILASEFFIADHAERLRYCPERGSYLDWNGRYWEWASLDDAIELGKETAGRLFDLAKAIMQQGDTDKGGKAMRFAARYHSIDGLAAMVRTAKSAKAIRVNYAELDADPEMLCARNGYAISLRTGKAYPPDRAKFFTRVAGVDYDPKATCPQWEAAMLAVFEGDQEMVDFMQRAIGYTATGYNSEEVFFCAFGHGENGKSVVQDTLTYVLGDMVCTGDVGALLVSRKNDTRIPNALAATAGARMLSLNETVGGDELDTRSLKLLAGREPISARFLHQEYFSFIPTATPWLRTNHRPVVRDDTHGTWRRIIPIPFRHQFTDDDRIPNIEQKLKSEGSGILNWIVAGGVEYFKRGLSIPASIRREAQAYRSESDVLGQFLEEQTTADPTFRIEQNNVWYGWRSYCHGNGHHPGTKNSLSRRLKERGFAEWKSNGKRFYRGLTMRSAQGGVPARA